MKLTVNIQSLDYGDVAMLALPVLREKLPAEDTAITRILGAVTRLPEDIIRQVFQAMSAEDKNTIVSMLVEEHKDKLLTAFSTFLQAHQLAKQLTDIRLTPNLDVELSVTHIDYASLVERFLPRIRNRLEGSTGTAATVLRRLPNVNPRRVLTFMPQITKDSIAAYLVANNQEILLQMMMEEARKNGIRITLSSISAAT